MLINLFSNILNIKVNRNKSYYISFYYIACIFLINIAYADHGAWTNMHIQNNLPYPVAIGFNAPGMETTDIVPAGGMIFKDDLGFGDCSEPEICVNNWHFTVFLYTENNQGSDELADSYIIMSYCYDLSPMLSPYHFPASINLVWPKRKYQVSLHIVSPGEPGKMLVDTPTIFIDPL